MSDSKGLEVELEGLCFTPTVLRIEQDETVTWTNDSSMPHTVTGANESWGDRTQFGLGDSVSQTFTETGVYPYYCALHPGMVGAVVVGDGTPSAASASLSVQPGDGPDRAVDAVDGEDGGVGTASTALIAGLGVALAASSAGGGLLVARRLRR